MAKEFRSGSLSLRNLLPCLLLDGLLVVVVLLLPQVDVKMLVVPCW